MDVNKAIKKEKLVRCRDCANYPTMCGYYQNKNMEHFCPDRGEGQHGFRPATEMNLKDTIYSFKMHRRGHDKNTALFDMVLFYLQRSEVYGQAYGELECILLNMVNFKDISQDEFMRIKRIMKNIKQKYFSKEVKNNGN